MILTLAWKNIFRSKRRSFVVVGAITVGVWALIFLFSFLNSFNEAYIRNAIKFEHSHIQLHDPEYLTEKELKYTIAEASTLIDYLQTQEQVAAFSTRQIINGMIASSKSSKGIQIYGIEEALEDSLTSLSSLIQEGTYFEQIKRNPILVSQKTADKLNLKIKSKVVLTFQDIDGEITSAAFRVSGIFDSKAPRINEGVVYVRQTDINRLVKSEGVSEIALLLKEEAMITTTKAALKMRYDHLSIRSFDEIAPEFDLLKQQSVVSKQVLTGIIMLALLFGIVNTMLMTVLERTKEIGMLRSIGMHKRKVFGMIVDETILLALIGAPVGLLFGYLTNLYFGTYGMDLSAYSSSLKSYGYDTIFYPSITASTYPILSFVVVMTSLIGALYPAFKAIQLNPLEAIRKL